MLQTYNCRIIKYFLCPSHELVQLILPGTENRLKHSGSIYFNQIQINVNLIWAKATDTVVTVSKHGLEPTDLNKLEHFLLWLTCKCCRSLLGP